MAKSFYTILEEGTIEVNHRGEDVTLNLPEWIKAAAPALESESDLLEWAQEYEVLHGLLHSGLQQEIIRLRAAARPAVNVKDDTSLSIIADKANAQKRIDDYVCKIVQKPGTGASNKIKKAEFEAYVRMASAMKTSGVPTETIKTTLGNACDNVTVALILNEIAAE